MEYIMSNKIPEKVNDFFVCIKETMNKGEKKLGVFLCGEDEPNKYHCSEPQRLYDDMVKMGNHLGLPVKAWTPKNPSQQGFIPEVRVHNLFGVYLALTNGQKAGKRAPAKALSIKDVLSIG